MVQTDLMAEHVPPGDNLPTWLTVALSVTTAVAGLKAWGPVGRWLERRLDAAQKAKDAERADMLGRLAAELKASREENVALRQELGEERELRMVFAQDYAVLRERVENLTKAMAEDKRDCQREIRRLNGEIRRLTGEIAELRQAHGGAPS